MGYGTPRMDKLRLSGVAAVGMARTGPASSCPHKPPAPIVTGMLASAVPSVSLAIKVTAPVPYSGTITGPLS